MHVIFFFGGGGVMVLCKGGGRIWERGSLLIAVSDNCYGKLGIKFQLSTPKSSTYCSQD